MSDSNTKHNASFIRRVLCYLKTRKYLMTKTIYTIVQITNITYNKATEFNVKGEVAIKWETVADETYFKLIFDDYRC